jgi:hypothetical protein
VPVASDAAVTVNILSSDETGDSQTTSIISLSKLATYGDIRGSLFWVTTHGRHRDRHRRAVDALTPTIPAATRRPFQQRAREAGPAAGPAATPNP